MRYVNAVVKSIHHIVHMSPTEHISIPLRQLATPSTFPFGRACLSLYTLSHPFHSSAFLSPGLTLLKVAPGGRSFSPSFALGRSGSTQGSRGVLVPSSQNSRSPAPSPSAPATRVPFLTDSPRWRRMSSTVTALSPKMRRWSLMTWRFLHCGHAISTVPWW
ncbi:hypothetical protein VTG60DRAFT_801 [Thermothelomyces hinnuleus]